MLSHRDLNGIIGAHSKTKLYEKQPRSNTRSLACRRGEFNPKYTATVDRMFHGHMTEGVPRSPLETDAILIIDTPTCRPFTPG